MSGLAAWALASLAGAVRGVFFMSWSLPLTIPMRLIVTAMIVVALTVTGSVERLAAGGFLAGMAAATGVLLALAGWPEDLWLVPVMLLLGVGLHAAGLRGWRSVAERR